MGSNATVLQTLLIGYLIGSIPFAFMITRWATGGDVRIEGSGNVGTRNAFRVSRKRWVGIVVLLADMLKGAVPVIAMLFSADPERVLVLIPALVLGHCYPVWLRFRGGKGLATTAGALLVSFPLFPIFWGLAYLVVKKLRDDSDFATIVACGASLVMMLIVPAAVVRWTAIGAAAAAFAPSHVVLAVCLVLLIILSRHIEEFRTLVRSRAESE
jgi:glycerol-3-phosphate acyltransferase PlsY